jgi:signal transduction histidine kinase
MLIKFISYIPAILGLIAIGFFVFLNNIKSSKNTIFALLTVFMAFWLGALFVGDTTSSLVIAIWSLRLGLFFAAFMFYAIYLFSLVFPFKSRINIAWQAVIAIPFIVTALTSFSSLQVQTVSIQGFGVQPETVGQLYVFSDITAVLYILSAMGILAFKYRKSDKLQQNQIKLVIYGLVVALVLNVFSGTVLTMLKINSDLISLGGISILVFALFVAYAIIWKGFLDIRSVVARSVAYVLALGTIGGFTALIIYLITARFSNANISDPQLKLLFVFVALVFAVLYQPLKQFFDKITNKYFYQDAYEPQDLLNKLNTSLVTSVDLNQILKTTCTLVEEYIKSSEVIFYINKTDQGIERSYSIKEKNDEKLNKIFHIVQKTPKKIYSFENEDLTSEVKQQANNLGVSLVAQLSSPKQSGPSIGSIVLGPKKSGGIYGKQDYRVLEIIADELVIAIQNALRFEEIQQFNATLQKKVDDATKELKKANEKLIALDQTKDDFISMASHQLRTPLTSVKGYISMVVEGDVGKITKQQHKLLDQAFLSSQRMVYLIADLLNVSRLKTGKFIIEPKPTNLADLVEGELSQLMETAKSRNLTLNYTKPDNFPLLMLDDTKTRQVVMNFADNAIYYTMAGGKIDVEVKDTGKTIDFTVTDNGIGVPKNEKHNLFSKFYRANNAKRARPDGTGLGLFMAKKVIIAQGGSIIFQSEEGKGSTFGFSFDKTKLMPKNVSSEATTDKHKLDK